jgi:hypothetical protein
MKLMIDWGDGASIVAPKRSRRKIGKGSMFATYAVEE